MPRPPASAVRPLPSHSERSLRIRFSGLALDRRYEWRVHPERLPAAWSDARLIVVDCEGGAIAEGDRLATLSARPLDPAAFAHASFLGGQDGFFFFKQKTAYEM